MQGTISFKISLIKLSSTVFTLEMLYCGMLLCILILIVTLKNCYECYSASVPFPTSYLYEGQL